MSPPLLVTLALGALCASLALLTAHLGLPVVADVLVVGAALLGVSAFLVAAVATVRGARRVPGPGPQ
jgi:hypothetical protein